MLGSSKIMHRMPYPALLCDLADCNISSMGLWCADCVAVDTFSCATLMLTGTVQTGNIVLLDSAVMILNDLLQLLPISSFNFVHSQTVDRRTTAFQSRHPATKQQMYVLPGYFLC